MLMLIPDEREAMIQELSERLDDVIATSGNIVIIEAWNEFRAARLTYIEEQD